jgi:Tfp pilus assembly protein PilX
MMFRFIDRVRSDKMRVHYVESTNTGREGGFALLVAVLISSVVLAVGLSMLEITLKQYVFSGTGRESEIAFYVADAVLECALYQDNPVSGDSAFTLGENLTTVTCMGVTTSINVTGTDSILNDNEDALVQFDWTIPGSSQAVCGKIGVMKVNGGSGVLLDNTIQCDISGSQCTRIEARGYNKACNQLNSARVVERALRATY